MSSLLGARNVRAVCMMIVAISAGNGGVPYKQDSPTDNRLEHYEQTQLLGFRQFVAQECRPKAVQLLGQMRGGPQSSCLSCYMSNWATCVHKQKRTFCDHYFLYSSFNPNSITFCSV